MIRAILAASAAFAFLGGIALAQEAPGGLARKAPILESIPAIAAEPAPPITEFVAGQAPRQLLATDFIGLTVHDPAGIALGPIDDILFDEAGRLSVVVLNVSDFLGTDKRVAFALDGLRQQAVDANIRLIASIARDTLEAAPDFNSLAEEMTLNDAQSLTADEAAGGPVDAQPAN